MAEFKRSIVSIQKIKDGLEEHSTDEAAMDAITEELYDLDKNGQVLMMLGEARKKAKNHYDSLNASKSDNKFNPFSYQKKAVRDFIYTFKRKGILSDQVGMGKTIEAGMILSELACRQELKSLLILVPSATMVYKWEKELSSKFGFRNYYEDVMINGTVINQKDFPRIITVNDKEDMNVLLFDALDKLDQDTDLFPDVNLNDMIQEAFDACFGRVLERCKSALGKLVRRKTPEFGAKVFKVVVPELVKDICAKLATHPRWPRDLGDQKYRPSFEKYEKWEEKHPVDVEGVYTLISDYYSQECTTEDELYDKCLDKIILRNSIISQFNFCKAEYGEIVKERIKRKVENSKMSALEKRVMLASIAEQIRNSFAVMIVGNEKIGDDYWLNEQLFECKDPALQYLYGSEYFYTYFDLLIDIQFSTVIVDEVHNYIDVVRKNPTDYSVGSDECAEFHMFELFRKGKNISDGYDQYLIRRKCLFAKLLTLSNHANQKMFMTATPIKSDMIDFYLLNLLRGRDNHLDFSLDRIDRNAKTQTLDYNALADNAKKILGTAIDNTADGRALSRACFNYITRKDLVCSVISELKYKFFQEKWDDVKEDVDAGTRPLLGDFIVYRVNHYAEEPNWDKSLANYKRETKANWGSRIDNILEKAFGDEAIADVVYNIANGERMYFEEKFITYAKDDDEKKNPIPIKTIEQLVASEAGMDEWRKKYSSLGIRTTRHQTDSIEEPWLSLLKPEFRSNYGLNNGLPKMPTWSCRNSTVFTICRMDRYFDYVACLNMNNLIAVLGGENSIASKSKTTKELLRLDQYVVSDKGETRRIATPKNWAALEQKMRQQIAALDKEYQSNQDAEEYLIQKDEAVNAFKDQVSEFLYHAVIDDGMAGVCKTNYFTQEGLPDYLVGRMHILLMLMQGSVKSQDSSDKEQNIGFNKGFAKKAKVLVFAREEVNQKLYELLLAEIAEAEKIGDNPAKKEAYFNQRGHYPFAAEDWLISTNIGDLQQKSSNVLVIVPPNKYEEGVDLQKATHLVNFDIVHSPLAMEQRIGRIDRVRPENRAGDRNIYIYSFTPLNDWSGFSTSFLAYYLKLFNRWNGDTTGIVSFPVSEQENLSTFDSIVREMEDAYKILSDHAEGEAVMKAYSTIKGMLTEAKTPTKLHALKEDRSSDKDSLKNVVKNIRNVIKKLYFQYDGNKNYVRAVYDPSNVKDYAELDTHIYRQAKRLSAHMQTLFNNVAKTLHDNEKDCDCLDSLSDILKELNVDRDPVLEAIDQNWSVLWDTNKVFNDLRFIYYQHFFADITCSYTKMLEIFKLEKDVDWTIPFKDKRTVSNPNMRFDGTGKYSDRAGTLLNAWEAYWSGITLQDENESVKKKNNDGSGFVIGQGEELSAEERYEELLEKQWSGSDNVLAKKGSGCEFHYSLAAHTSAFHGEAKGVTVFTIYNRIINKYMYPLLAMYIYLCRQVHTRLESMASIIEKGAVDELKAMLEENLSAFKDAVEQYGEGGAQA